MDGIKGTRKKSVLADNGVRVELILRKSCRWNRGSNYKNCDASLTEANLTFKQDLFRLFKYITRNTLQILLYFKSNLFINITNNLISLFESLLSALNWKKGGYIEM